MNPCFWLVLSSLLLHAIFPKQSIHAAVKVACVGDSITAGKGLGAMSYSSRLGSLLGSDYTVRNYGAGGYCLLKNVPAVDFLAQVE